MRPGDVGSRAVYALLSLLTVASLLGIVRAAIADDATHHWFTVFIGPAAYGATWVLLLGGRRKAGTLLLFGSTVGVAVVITALTGTVAGEPFVLLILVLITVGLDQGSRVATMGGLVSAAATIVAAILVREGFLVAPDSPSGAGLGPASFHALSLLLVTLMLVIGIRHNEALVAEVGEVNDALSSELEERTRVSAALAQNQAELAAILDSAPIGVVTAATDGRILRVDGAIAHLLDDPVLDLPTLVSPTGWNAVECRIEALRESAGPVEPLELTIERATAQPLECRVHFGLVAVSTAGTAAGDGPDDAERCESDRVVLMIEDVTEQRRIEQKLRSEQRHQHMGLVAGRVAHDFNNLMAAVLAQAAAATEQASRGESNLAEIEHIKVGARTAALLTRQLVTYAGNAPQEPEVLDLNQMIGGIRELFGATLPPGVDLTTDFAPRVAPVVADRTQLQQVVMNLLINAAQAMEGRTGSVHLVTRDLDLDGDRVAQWSIASSGLPPGRYAGVDVTDEGPGIEPDVAARMWDPFFTTRVDGHGLGLSVVRGVIRSHGGALRVGAGSAAESGVTIGFVLPEASTLLASDSGRGTDELIDLRGTDSSSVS